MATGGLKGFTVKDGLEYLLLLDYLFHVCLGSSHVGSSRFYSLFQPKLCRPTRPRTASEDPLKVKKKRQIADKSANPTMSKPPQI